MRILSYKVYIYFKQFLTFSLTCKFAGKKQLFQFFRKIDKCVKQSNFCIIIQIHAMYIRDYILLRLEEEKGIPRNMNCCRRFPGKFIKKGKTNRRK